MRKTAYEVGRPKVPTAEVLIAPGHATYSVLSNGRTIGNPRISRRAERK